MKPDKKRKGNTFKRVLENHKQVKQMQTQFLQNYYDLALLSEMWKCIHSRLSVFCAKTCFW